ncbi:MAG: MraY family glycosyltransferase [Porticoccaceae bacterium]
MPVLPQGLASSAMTIIRFGLMLLGAGLAFGLIGLGFMALMYLLSLLAQGRDAAASHGISTTDSSRFGGLAIGIVFILFIGGVAIFSPYTPGFLRANDFLYIWSAVFICCVLGLIEDFKPDYLPPKLRLASKFIVFGLLLYIVPGLLPRQVGSPVLDWLMQVDFIAWVITLIFCVGFVNAMNMADGANGLVPGIATCALFIIFITYGRPAEAALLFTCFTFLIFNVVTGRFFLGDMGSYGLGSILVIFGLNGVAAGDFSPAFMAALLAYPCVDFVVSIGRRLARGYSPFAADNGHLHNLLYRWLKPRLRHNIVANSLTGLMISGSSAGLVLLGYLNGWWPPTSPMWAWVFVLEVALYCTAMVLLKRSGLETEYAEGH